MISPRQPPQPQHSATGRIPLLALHGFTGCGADFQWLAAQTADLFEWHTFDFPGHGTNANARKSAHTPAAIAHTISATLDAIIVAQQRVLLQAGASCCSTQVETDRHASAQHETSHSATAPETAPQGSQAPLPLLLGYSMGGRMALRALAQYGTSNVGGLILIGASAGLPDPAERRNRRQSDHTLATRIETEGIDAFMQHWNNVPLIASQRNSPYFGQLQQMRQANSPQGLALSLRSIGTGAVAPVHSRLPQLNVPCLLLTGAEDTKFTAIANSLANTMPQTQHVRIPDAGHSPHWENPQFTEATLRTWLGSQFPAHT